MDNQDHQMTPTSTGHEGHEVHLCHRCGWPFPNPHPSSRHRRAHKRVCGTIEGYKVIHSEEDDHHLAVSDDEHASDEDGHTPSPKLAKKNAEFGSSGRVAEKSNRSEDDVFSDAVTEFSESGISPRLEERFESVKGLDKSMEQKSVEGDLYRSQILKVDETDDQVDADKTELNDPTSTDNPGALVNVNDHSESVIPVTDARADAVSVGPRNPLHPDLIKSEILRDEVIDIINENGDRGVQQGLMTAGRDADIQGEEDKSASVILDSEEGKISNPALIAKEELCDKLSSEVVEHELSPPTGTLQNMDASVEVKIVADSVEASNTTKPVGEVALAQETHESIDASMGVTKASASDENIGSIGAVGGNTIAEESVLGMPSVKPGGSAHTSASTEHSDVVSTFSSVDKEVEQTTSLAIGENVGNPVASEGEKCDMPGNESRNLESKDKFYVETVSAPGSADNSFEPEDDQTTRALKKDVNHCDEKPTSKLLEAGNERGEGAASEVKVMLDPVIPSVNSTDFPSSFEVGSGVRNVEELSKTESNSTDSRDNGFEKTFQGFNTGKVTEVLLSVGSAGFDAGLNHDIGDVLDKRSPTATFEDPVSPVISKLPNNIHVTSDVNRVESVDVAGMVAELKDYGGEGSEKTPGPPISKESTHLFSNSELLSDNSANDNSCIGNGTRASESIDAAEVSTELNHDGNAVVLIENSLSLSEGEQEVLPVNQKCSDETSPGVEETPTSEDVRTSVSVGIVSGAELTCDGNVVTSDTCSVIPSSEEPVLSPLDSQGLHEISATGDDKYIINGEHVSGVNSRSLQDEGDDNLPKQNYGISAMDLSGSSNSISDSLEGNCGSVSALSSQSNTAVADMNSQSPDKLETNSQKQKTTTEEGHPDKSDVFEPPSFMTLVQSGDQVDQVTGASEIEKVQNNQQTKAGALQAGWFPSLANVVNESEGRKKNEEIIAKVTNWSPGKQHSPLKNLLNEVKSPNTKQVPATNQKDATEPKDNGAGFTTVNTVLGPEAPKDHDTNKDMEEWNSPARYPVEIKKEKKKKGKPYWVPFVCCSSVHRDL